MEDAHFHEDGFGGVSHQGFFCIYDGHGGKEAAVFASNTLHNILLEELKNLPEGAILDKEKVESLFKTVYNKTDEAMKETVPSHHGCTAVTVFITGEGENRRLIVANAGDARAVLCREGKAVRLTYDHKPTDESEVTRVTGLGGFIMNDRLNGQIAITRALGDHLMKEYVISDPYVSMTPVTENDKFVIVACDGLWDVIEDQQAIDFCLENSNDDATLLSKKLLIKALKDGSTDNLSVMVLRL